MPVTLITGATSGIGAATARALLAAGHQVTVTGRDPAKLAAFAASTSAASARPANAGPANGGPADGGPADGGPADGGPADALLTVAGDAADEADVRRAVAETVARFGRLDHVVANAGYSTHDTLATGDPAAWREMLLVNTLGPMLLIHAALPALTAAAAEGLTPRIVLIGSVAGLRHSPGNVYSVTKWAVTSLAENTRLLVTERGIGVTLIAPGRVQTPFWAGRGGGAPGPTLAEGDIAGTIAWTLAQPVGVDVNTVVVRPVGQSG